MISIARTFGAPTSVPAAEHDEVLAKSAAAVQALRLAGEGL